MDENRHGGAVTELVYSLEYIEFFNVKCERGITMNTIERLRRFALERINIYITWNRINKDIVRCEYIKMCYIYIYNTK